MSWITFAYSLSKEQSSTRVTLWRRLQRLGAIAPAGNLYLLPAHDDCVEAFQWLTQEIQTAGGQAIMLHTDQIEGMTEQGLIDLFCDARAKEYAALEAEAAELARTLDLETPDALDTLATHLTRLRRQLADIARIDYFDCPQGQVAASKIHDLEQRLGGVTATTAPISPLNPADFQGQTWATRPHPYVDRLASIWLIRRFIDPLAQIIYTTNPQPDHITFDMPGARFGHVGPRCTLETLIATFQIEISGLPKVAEIVHEIDLHDQQFHHPETPGIEMVLQGWRRAALDDQTLESCGLTLFDGLLSAFSE